MTTDYHSRYLAGKRSEVWRQLCRLKQDVYSKRVFDDAMAVARTIVDRAAQNLEKLHGDLQSIGYQFEYPRLAFVPANGRTTDAVEAVRKELKIQ